MIAASTKHLSPKQIVTPFFIGEGKTLNRSIGLLKQFLADNRGMMVGDFESLAFIFELHAAAADFLHLAFADYVGADIPLILQHPQDC